MKVMTASSFMTIFWQNLSGNYSRKLNNSVKEVTEIRSYLNLSYSEQFSNNRNMQEHVISFCCMQYNADDGT